MTGPERHDSDNCPYCAGEMCGRLDGLGCTHDRIERHGYFLDRRVSALAAENEALLAEVVRLSKPENVA